MGVRLFAFFVAGGSYDELALLDRILAFAMTRYAVVSPSCLVPACVGRVFVVFGLSLSRVMTAFRVLGGVLFGVEPTPKPR